MCRHLSCLISALALFSISAAADVVTLKNGDRLTGSIVKIDGDKLVFKSLYAGEVKVPWDQVSALTSNTTVFVGLKDGNVLTGTLSLEGDQLQVRSTEAGAVPAARAGIAYMRSKDEQAAYELEIERFRNPRLVDLWTGFVDFGLAKASGNASTTSVTTSASAVRMTSRDKISVSFTSLYASATTLGQSLVTANAIRGGVKYEMNLTPRIFAFASTDLEYDQFQQLDLRFAPAGGLGQHVWKADRGFFDWQGGVSLNREFFSTGLNRTSAEALVGEEFLYRLNSKTSVREKLIVFPNLSNTGEYRLNFDTSADTALWRWLSWHVTLSDRLLSDPVPGRKKNDVLFTTGFRVTFAR